MDTIGGLITQKGPNDKIRVSPKKSPKQLVCAVLHSTVPLLMISVIILFFPLQKLRSPEHPTVEAIIDNLRDVNQLQIFPILFIFLFTSFLSFLSLAAFHQACSEFCSGIAA